MTYVERVAFAGKFGLVLSTAIGEPPRYLVDDRPSPEQKAQEKGRKLHFPKEEPRLLPRKRIR